MLKNNIISIIKDIKLSSSNVYYENSSADGFAFLGQARARVGLDYVDYYKAIKERNFSLNAPHKIRGTAVPQTNQYVYTLWTCIEFLSFIGEDSVVKELLKRIDDIGQYPNKMMRYCSTEVNFIVPNVTSGAALIYSITGKTDKVVELVQILRERQKNGNWKYYDLQTKQHPRVEDPYHVAMMVYHLREIEKITGIKTSDMVEKSLRRLSIMNKDGLQGGSIGWGVPMLCVATKKLDAGLYKRAFDRTIKESIRHKNFRVRAIAAWALTK